MLEILTRNWSLKLLALLAAFGIWVSITGDRPTIKDFTVPLEVLLAKDRILTSPPPKAVTVRLEGPAPMIRSLDPLRLAMRVDLTTAQIGERDVQLTEAELTVPQGVTVAFLDPDRVRLHIDRRVRRSATVKVDLTGELPAEYKLYHVRVRPDRLTIEGPETVIDQITEVRTDPIALGGRDRMFDETVRAVPDGAQVRVIDPQPLEVRVVIDRQPVDVEFEDVPVFIAGQAAAPEGPAAAALTPETINVVLNGPESVLEKLKPGQIRVVADVAGLEPGRRAHRVEVTADLVDIPEDLLHRITVKTVRPQQISVRLTERSPTES